MSDLIRPRRLRSSSFVRDLVAETLIDCNKLIMPYFIMEGESRREPIKSMPGIERVSIDNLLKDIELDSQLGVRYLLFFGIPDTKDEKASSAYAKDGVVQKALRAVKDKFPDLCLITDVCLCEYMSHGHCGVVSKGKVLNDPSLELIAKTALSHVEAGADIVAPSDMMDGRVLEIRKRLDSAGYYDTPILSYAVKFASSFYGPFRDAAGSTPSFGDRRTYQMDYRNKSESLREALQDLKEGADILMVKPALSYLDIISKVKNISNNPLCAYNVSGEYAMVKASASLGYGDEELLVKEVLTSIFRAGADMIISYHTRDVFKNQWGVIG